MSVRAKLVLILVLVALLPLAVSTATAVAIHRRAYNETIENLYRTSADLGVALVSTRVEQASRSLELLAGKTIDWTRLSAKEREGAVSLIYQQQEDIALASLVDENGRGLENDFVETSAAPTVYPGHPRLGSDALALFGAHIPFDAARAKGIALGEAFAASPERFPILPIAVRAGTGTAPWIVATGLSLRSVCQSVLAGSEPGVERFVLDGKGRVLCGPEGFEPLSPLDSALVDAALADPRGVAVHRDAQSGVEVLAAAARVPWGWTVLVREPAAVAFAAGRRMRFQSEVWILAGLALAIAAGLLLSRGTDRALARLVVGAQELSRGSLEYRLPEGRDEFGRVSAAFNEMSTQIQKRDAEIKAWNVELQKRVEERTRDLQEAQAELLQSHKLAAVGALGAGMAHEINNPLTSVLGIAQVLKMRAEEGDPEGVELLASLETEAARIKSIVAGLLASSSATGGMDSVSVDRILDAAAKQAGQELSAQGIEVVRNSAKDLPPIRGRSADLIGVIVQLLSNARVALKGRPSPRIVISTEVVSGQLVKIAIADNGKGIAPEHLDRIFEPFFTTKDEWNSRGLGLTTVFRTVREHDGTIKVASVQGEGATMTLTFPVARKSTVLA